MEEMHLINTNTLFVTSSLFLKVDQAKYIDRYIKAILQSKIASKA